MVTKSTGPRRLPPARWSSLGHPPGQRARARRRTSRRRRVAGGLLLLACDLSDPSGSFDSTWWDPIGMLETVSCVARFKRTFIPLENLIGQPGQYFRDEWQSAVPRSPACQSGRVSSHTHPGRVGSSRARPCLTGAWMLAYSSHSPGRSQPGGGDRRRSRRAGTSPDRSRNPCGWSSRSLGSRLAISQDPSDHCPESSWRFARTRSIRILTKPPFGTIPDEPELL